MPLQPLSRYGLRTAIVLMGSCLVAVTLGCKRSRSPGSTSAPVERAQRATNAATATKLLPLESKSDRVSLDSSDLTKAELRIPLGITEPASVVVVLGEPAEMMNARCDQWHTTLKQQRFVLCQAELELNGTRRVRADTSTEALRTNLRAIKRRFGAYVSSKDLALVGTATSSDIVVDLVRKSPEFFPRIVLVEGGFSNWTAVDTGRFSRVEAARALLLCSSKTCEEDANRVFATLRASGVQTKLLHDEESLDTSPPKQFPTDFDEELSWLLSDQAK